MGNAHQAAHAPPCWNLQCSLRLTPRPRTAPLSPLRKDTLSDLQLLLALNSLLLVAAGAARRAVDAFGGGAAAGGGEAAAGAASEAAAAAPAGGAALAEAWAAVYPVLLTAFGEGFPDAGVQAALGAQRATFECLARPQRCARDARATPWCGPACREQS
jgi:hypothetical protein